MKENIKIIQSFEEWCYTIMLNLSCLQKKINDWVTKRKKKKKLKENDLFSEFNWKKKVRIYWYLTRNKTVLTRILMSKIEEKKSRGRQGVMWLQNIKYQMGMTLEKMINAAKNHLLLIANST